MYFLALIDDITDRVDGTSSRIRRETRNIEKVDKKSASCGKTEMFTLCLQA